MNIGEVLVPGALVGSIGDRRSSDAGLCRALKRVRRGLRQQEVSGKGKGKEEWVSVHQHDEMIIEEYQKRISRRAAFAWDFEADGEETEAEVRGGRDDKAPFPPPPIASTAGLPSAVAPHVDAVAL